MRLIRKAVNRALRMLPPSGTLRGYDCPEVIECIFRKSAAYRDQRPWPELADATSVLDFGGGFGIHCRRAASQRPDVRWAIVETPQLVSRAHCLESDHLQFFPTIAAAAEWLGSVDAVYSNAALGYSPSPERCLAELCDIGAPKMVWDRQLLSAGEREGEVQRSLLAENGPGLSFSRKRVEVKFVRMSERDFLQAHASYRLLSRAGHQSDRNGESFIFTKCG